MEKGTLGEEIYLSGKFYPKKMSVRDIVIISRIRMAENLGRGLGKKAVNITYLNNQNGRILVGIKSQEILG